MRIATHNVLFLFGEGTHVHSGKEWHYSTELVESRISHFANLFLELDADILFLQEVASEDMLRRIVERMGGGYSWYLAEPDKYGVGNAVMSKSDLDCFSVPATNSLPVFVEGDEDTLGPRVFSRRDFVAVRMEHAGKPLLMLGVHFKAGFLVSEKDGAGSDIPMKYQLAATDGLIRSEFFRFAQARAARQAIDLFLADNPDGEIVIAGDYNAREGDVLYRIVKGVLKEGENFLVNATDMLPENERVGVNGKKLIDHVMLSGNLAECVKSVRTLNEGAKESRDIPPIPLAVRSDHPAVVVELT